MSFFVIFSITLILGISYSAIKKNLHPFEILFIWMIVIIIHHNFMTIAADNLRMINFANQPANYWALVFNRVVLIPLLIVIYFDRMVVRRPYEKWIWLPVGILLLAGVEYLSEWLGLYTYTRWKVWWTFLEWFVIFMLIHFPWLGYRRLLTKELA